LSIYTQLHQKTFAREIRDMAVFWDRWHRRNSFAASAPGRDDWTVEDFFASGAKDWSGIREFFPPSPNDTLLDYGCGAGRMLPGLKAEVREYVGVDVSGYALDNISTVADNLQLQKVSVQITNGVDLKAFETGVFDFILSYNVFQYLRKTEIAKFVLREFLRVLRVGGRALVRLQCFEDSRNQLIETTDFRQGVSVAPAHLALLLNEHADWAIEREDGRFVRLRFVKHQEVGVLG
jgi:SAM-dependent methyltransferase